MVIISSEAAVTLAPVASTSIALVSSQTSNISTNEDTSSLSANAAETTTITTPQTSQASQSQALSLPSISSEPTSRSSPPSQSSTPSIKNRFSTVIAKLSGSLLEDADLSVFLRTARFSRTACQSDMRDRKRVKEELLPHIFNGNPDAVNKFFETQGTTFTTLKLLITKARFREGYQSEKFNQFICFREWRGVSPLQAAALCGDTFLLDNLKELIIGKNTKENQHIIEENIEKNVDDNQPLIQGNKSQLENIRQEAIRQLEEVRSRVSTQKIILEAAAVVVGTYSNNQDKKNAAKLRLKEIQELETFQQQMKAFRKEMETLRNQMNNLSEASKVSAASEAPKTQQQKDVAAGPMATKTLDSERCRTPKTLDSERCRTPFVKGVDTAGVGGIYADVGVACGDRKTSAETKASSESTHITHADSAEFLAPVLKLLMAYIDHLIQYPALSESIWGELDKLWEIVGECHKRLPHYFKQEFFDNKPFFPRPSFENSPSRGCCRYYSGKLLILDGLGFGTYLGLYKGGDHAPVPVGRTEPFSGGRAMSRAVCHDLSAVTRLYELRLTGLENIIVQLRTPEIIENLDPHQSNRSPDVGAGPGL